MHLEDSSIGPLVVAEETKNRDPGTCEPVHFPVPSSRFGPLGFHGGLFLRSALGLRMPLRGSRPSPNERGG